MFLIRDSIIVTIFTVLISGAAGGLVATLYNAYYYEQIRKDIELEVRHKRDDSNTVSSKEDSQRDSVDIEETGYDKDNPISSEGVIEEQELSSEEEKFYKELKDEIEVQEK